MASPGERDAARAGSVSATAAASHDGAGRTGAGTGASDIGSRGGGRCATRDGWLMHGFEPRFHFVR